MGVKKFLIIRLILLNNLVKLSRNIFFYKDIELKDDFDTRIILIFLHFSIIIKKFKKSKFPQELFDNIFQNIEYNLREEGYGDVSVNKKMKILNKIFYDILLKVQKTNSDKLRSIMLYKKSKLYNKTD